MATLSYKPLSVQVAYLGLFDSGLEVAMHERFQYLCSINTCS